MKRTTTWVFVSPVRPQNSQSQIIYGLSGRVAGAHRQCLPAAQDGQTKRLSRKAGGRLKLFWGGYLFLVLLFSWLACGLVSADNKVPPLSDKTAAQTQVTAQLAASCTQLGSGNKAPTMVAIRPGHFKMGSPSSEAGRDADEDPQHAVTIPRPFSISRCEITVGQFRQFIKDTGYKTTSETNGKGCYAWDAEKKDWKQQANLYWDKPAFSQTDKHPVVCVSWHDVQRYVDWLSQRTGVLYRLPTEAEWEYAARAGTKTARFYDDNKQCDYANGLGQEAESIADPDWELAQCRDNYIYTAPVASFVENQFGLFDMLGNVLEWTVDCWHKNYQKAPYNGLAWLEQGGGECDRRVVRGGSWYILPGRLRGCEKINLQQFCSQFISVPLLIVPVALTSPQENS